ncbi:protein phosphatase 2C domain-containing protein [Catenulispora rubra]|uniref:protein phosphatase 2C domain-containing protein n=1 Tax=Catenulispora rubra TaxID=280293 RepID=UPI0018922337|nr:protein phosphatase 2C domain-containing protein [Catenulispora rubra]
MADPEPGERWQVLQGTVRGANKKYSQDRHNVSFVGGDQAVVLVVADGHGSRIHARSHLGAQWAVEAFTRCATPFARRLLEFETEGRNGASWPVLYQEAKAMPRSICRLWRERARIHEANGPSDGTVPAGRIVGVPQLVAYGSTVVGAVVTGHHVVCWRLGDGDIVLMGDGVRHGEDRGGGTLVRLFAEDDDIGDDTDSLCGPEPWYRMRVHGRPLTGLGRHKLILLNTDGLSKSYRDMEGYEAFATDLHERLSSRSVEWAQPRLNSWLERSAGFSGDDTTLVAAYAA